MNMKFEEFGLNINTLRDRVLYRNSLPQPLLANAIPKSGTNLLLRLLLLLPFYTRTLSRTISLDDSNCLGKLKNIKKGKFLTGHVIYTSEISTMIDKEGIKNILMIRNPLDVALSNVRYITIQDKNHRLHSHFSTKLDNDVDRFLASLNGVSSDELGGLARSRSILEHYEDYQGWLDSKNTLIVKYEELVGAQGGGCDIAQRRCIEKVAIYLGLKCSQSALNVIQDNLFSNKSRTFHKGRINRGEEFIRDNSLVSSIDSNLEKLMTDYGYDIS